MKTVNLPTQNARLRIFRKDELQAFLKRYKIEHGSQLCLTCETGIWIGDVNVDSCAHEATHYVDWLLEDWLECEQGTLASNNELRAYLVGYVTQKVWDYVSSPQRTV